MATNFHFFPMESRTRNSSGDEIANVNFLYDDIIYIMYIYYETGISVHQKCKKI